MTNLITAKVLACCVLLVIVESLGQLYYRWTHGAFLPELHAERLRDAHELTTVFEQHPYLVARPKRNVSVSRGRSSVSTTSIHTRVTGTASPGRDVIRVAIVGGSTTFGTKVTDADTWPWLLQEQLKEGYEIINYGVPGYTTAEALIQMALIVPEAKPRILVFYEGWNDLRNYHWPGSGPDYYAHGMTQFDTLIPRAEDERTFWTRATHSSFLVSLLNRAVGTGIGAHTPDNERTAAGRANQPDPEVDRIYMRNLRTLKTLTRHLGAAAIFVPQVLNEQSYSRKSASRSWTPYIENAAVPRLMRRLNTSISDICSPDDDDCQFVGEVLTQQWDGNDFVDEGHFSRRGGEKLAAVLAPRIQRTLRR